MEMDLRYDQESSVDAEEKAEAENSCEYQIINDEDQKPQPQPSLNLADADVCQPCNSAARRFDGEWFFDKNFEF